jgi:site-specific recombinase XerD
MINRDNYHAVRAYLQYQSETMQRNELSIRAYRLHLNILLRWADEVAFDKAPAIRPVFPKYLSTITRIDRPSEKYTAQSVRRVCQLARSFFHWLLMHQPRQYSSVTPGWIDTLQPGKLAAGPHKEHQAVTLEQVRKLLSVDVAEEDIATRRDIAAAAFLFLSGMRATAFLTLPIECVDITARTVKQYPTLGVKTKNNKAAVTRLLEIPDLLSIVQNWDCFVRSQLPPAANWYPVIEQSFGLQTLTDRPSGQFRNRDFGRRIQRLFAKAELEPLTPHKFRHGHALYGLNRSRDMGDYKAVYMNLMHSDIGITDSVYAVLSDQAMQERIARLGLDDAQNVASDLASIVAEVLKQMHK